MAEGQVYVEVDASVVNGGIMPMAIISGNPEPVAGQESFGIWLLWRYDTETGEGGFTGQGWFWADENNALRDSFTSEEAFKEMLMRDTPSDLNLYLGSWGSERKAAFFRKNQEKLGAGYCFEFIG